MLQRVTAGVGIAVRTLALPSVLGLRWLGHLALPAAEAVALPRGVPQTLKAILDEVFFTTEIVGGWFIDPREVRRIRGEVEAALALFRRRGWLDEPARYHGTPPVLREVERAPATALGVAFEHVRFQSGYAPHAGEPGRERWLSYAPNRTAHAWVLRHEGRERPWLVCIPGLRMGHPAVDFTGFQARWLHHELGLNVAIPVLPFHGPRRTGRRGGDGFLSGDFLDTVHAKAQAVWDLRRLVSWLRRQGAPCVGLYGVSLGSYTAALVAALEEDLDCVIAGIPASDFLGIARWNAPAGFVRAAGLLGFRWPEIEEMLRVVSPLAIPSRVPRQRLFLYAGLWDRLAPPEQARRLWNHWGRPRLAWYEGSHVSFLLEREVTKLVLSALRSTGFLAPPRRMLRRRGLRAHPLRYRRGPVSAPLRG